MKKEILIIGGDLRQYYLAAALVEYGYTVHCYGDIFVDKALPKGSYCGSLDEMWQHLSNGILHVVLPVPVSADKITVKGTSGSVRLADLCPYVKGIEKLYGGNIPVSLRSECEIRQGRCLDFMKSERVALLNAIPTAEGAIVEACMICGRQLMGSKCLVIGYGRCGEILADRLKRLGAEVTVMARRARIRARAEAFAMYSCSMEDTAGLDSYDIIFNTVPALIINQSFLEKCSLAVTIIDIASAPGGVDYTHAKRLGINAKLCPGLPGKYAPKTAGEILAREIAGDIT